MGLTVRAMCKIIHELWPETIIVVQGLVDGNPRDNIVLYVYPDDDSYWGEREVSRVEISRNEHLKVVSVTLSVDIDSSIVIDRTKCEKEEKMKSDDKKDNREPLKLLTQLSYIEGDEGDDVWLEIRLEKRGENGSRYLFVEGFASNLKDEPGMFEDYYVERILYDDGNNYEQEEERHLLIQAVKEVSK